MGKNDLLNLARQAMRETNTNGDDTLTPWMVQFIERFGVLVTRAEREACARLAELVARQIDDTNGLATYVARAIRARGEA